MKEIISTITSKGQVTIPLEVRKYLGIKTNDKIGFVIDDEGGVRLRVPRYRTIASLKGAAGRLNKPLSWQEVQKIAKKIVSTQSMRVNNDTPLYRYGCHYSFPYRR